MKSKTTLLILALATIFNSFGQGRLSFLAAALPEEVVYAASNDSILLGF